MSVCLSDKQALYTCLSLAIVREHYQGTNILTNLLVLPIIDMVESS